MWASVKSVGASLNANVTSAVLWARFTSALLTVTDAVGTVFGTTSIRKSSGVSATIVWGLDGLTSWSMAVTV